VNPGLFILFLCAVFCPALLPAQAPRVEWVQVYSDGFEYGNDELNRRWIGATGTSWSSGVTEPFRFGPDAPFRTESGSLIAENQNNFFDNITCRSMFAGDIRIEWETAALKDNLNYNCFVSGRNRWDGLMFHVAAFGDQQECGVTSGVAGEKIASMRLDSPFSVGQTVRFSLEMQGATAHLYANGKFLLGARLPSGRPEGTRLLFGFENNLQNRQRIDNVKVFLKRVIPAEASVSAAVRPIEIPTGEERVLADFGNPPDGLEAGRWRLMLSPSIDSPSARNASDYSMVKPPAFDREEVVEKCLGLHVAFGAQRQEAWAQLRPDEPIDSLVAEEGKGIIRNTGPVRRVIVRVCGLEPGSRLLIRTRGSDGKVREYPFVPDGVSGWQTIAWVNPSFIRERREWAKRRVRGYPEELPFVSLESMVLHRSALSACSDEVLYIRDVRFECVPAVREADRSVRDEDVFGVWKEGTAP
jgi:hypothetical protein